MIETLIQIRDLTKTYQEGQTTREVLQQINVDIPAGQIVAILGRSGSGKSTFLNLLAGIDLPTAGEIRVNQIPLARLSEKDRTLYRREHIGFVFQFFNLIPTLTVLENLMLPLELKNNQKLPSQEKVFQFLEQLELVDRSHSFPDRLSGGEQQRVAIARALIHDPSLILADEPTGNLDSETSHTVLNFLAGMIRPAGKTMIVATHSEEVATFADRILTIQNGQLIEKNPLFSQAQNHE